MPPVKVDVISRHPLSQYYAYPKMEMIGIPITSIKMGKAFIFFGSPWTPCLANQLLNNEKLKWDPVMIEPWPQEHGIIVNANFLANAGAIYSLILFDQIDQKDSPFRKVLSDILAKMNEKDKEDVEFMVYTSSQSREMIFSTGKKFGEATNWYPGYNLYGKMLKLATQKLLHGTNSSSGEQLQHILEDDALFNPVKRSVLVISDSQWRLFDSISSRGLLVPVSGGRYADVTNVIDNAEFSLDDFKFVIIYCGTNTYVRPDYSNYKRQNDFLQLEARLQDALKRREKGTIMFSCAFDHPKVKGNPFHARWIKDELYNTGIYCINWRDEGNPYLLENGLVNEHYFDTDHFHLNDKGIQVLWWKFAEKLRGLEFFTYKVRDHGESVGRQIFASDKPQSSKSQKRRKRK